MRLKHGTPEPETRVGNCCGCNTFPVTLFKIPGVYRYRCAECFERETGYRHHQALTAVTPVCCCPSPPGRLAAHGAQVLTSWCPVHGEQVRPELWVQAS